MRRHIVYLTSLLSLINFSGAEAQQLASTTGERRVVFTLDQSDSNWVTLGVSQRRLSLRMAHAAIVHRLRVDLVDAQGEVILEGASWDVSIWSSSSSNGVMATLDETRPELRIPRPYGLRLNADDSLTVEVDVHALGAAGSTLRAVIDYELPDAGTSRLPVLALTSSRAMPSVGSTVQDAWTWQPTVEGRLVAVSGATLSHADEIVLEDVETGAVLWRTRTQRSVGASAAATGPEQIRPGVTLEEGRAYRLRTIYAANAAPSEHRRAVAPLAVMMPSSSASNVRAVAQ
jgi:hypothetical protein